MFLTHEAHKFVAKRDKKLTTKKIQIWTRHLCPWHTTERDADLSAVVAVQAQNFPHQIDDGVQLDAHGVLGICPKMQQNLPHCQTPCNGKVWQSVSQSVRINAMQFAKLPCQLVVAVVLCSVLYV